MQKVIVVEAPKKVKTLSKLLGPNYIVLATGGHIKDLSVKDISVDVLDDFAVVYELLPRKERVVQDLQRHKAYPIYICTDADREGERIGAHVADILKIAYTQPVRAAFRSLSADEVRRALDAPRPFNQDLLDAQEARRVIDRIMGYMVSRWLWQMTNVIQIRLVAAGRVQSAVLNCIVRREEEITGFVPQTHFLLQLKHPKDMADDPEKCYTAVQIKNLDEREDVKYESLNALSVAMDAYKKEPVPIALVHEEINEEKVPPLPPLITSSLIKLASTQYGWDPETIMKVAQELYESGYVTYIRTDNPNVAESFIPQAKAYYESQGWSALLADSPKGFKAPEGAQEAHEAIRPVDLNQPVDELGDPAKLLYALIHKRSLICLAKPARYQRNLRIYRKGTQFFKAYLNTPLELAWYTLDNKQLPQTHEPELGGLIPVQYAVTTKPPSRYTVATLLTEMDRLEIGRPSTYVSVFEVLKRHKYIAYTSNQSITPSIEGNEVIRCLRQYFNRFIEPGYTRDMEKALDEVATGKLTRQLVLSQWYEDFSSAYDAATAAVLKLLDARPKYTGVKFDDDAS